MIYTTGDTHVPLDIAKLTTNCFKEQKGLTKNDYVIICGDLGAVWDGSKEDAYWQKWLGTRNFTTLFVDGNHENFNLLNQYPITEWHGGKVQFINDGLIHLMRGQVYVIDGLKIFTMGGANSIDKHRRKEGVSWWKEEMPNNAEFEEALSNLDKHNWEVDIVISHTTSTANMLLMCDVKEKTPLNSFFDMLENDLKYTHWYFGHFHIDKNLNEKHTVLYENVVKIK